MQTPPIYEYTPPILQGNSHHTIYYNVISRKNNRPDTISYGKIDVKVLTNYFNERVRDNFKRQISDNSSANCIFDNFLDLTGFLGLPRTSFTFCLSNLLEIQHQLSVNIEIYQKIGDGGVISPNFPFGTI